MNLCTPWNSPCQEATPKEKDHLPNHHFSGVRLLLLLPKAAFVILVVPLRNHPFATDANLPPASAKTGDVWHKWNDLKHWNHRYQYEVNKNTPWPLCFHFTNQPTSLSKDLVFNLNWHEYSQAEISEPSSTINHQRLPHAITVMVGVSNFDEPSNASNLLVNF